MTRASRACWVTTEAEWPRLTFYRGPHNKPGRFFGPYPNAGAVRETLQQLQKLFKLRNCEDTFFENRSRPCLQHQIERCSAPCVGLIAREDYARDVESAVKVLEGRSEEVNEELGRQMEAAAARLDFENAARLRDQLAALKKVQAQQIVNAASTRDLDVVALASEAGEHCIAVMFVRGGRNLGTTHFFPRVPIGEPGEVHGRVRHAVLLRARGAARHRAEHRHRGPADTGRDALRTRRSARAYP